MVWLEGSMYPQTISGLGACYLAAVLFIHNSVAGDLFFLLQFLVFTILPSKISSASYPEIKQIVLA